MKVKPFIYLVAALMILMQGAMVAFGDPPGEGERGPREGGPRHERGDRDGDRGPHRPRPWEPGKIMPPPVREHLNLTSEQESKLESLEAEVKEKLLAILTDEQKEDLKDLPMGPPPGGFRGRPGGREDFRGGPGGRDGFRGPPHGLRDGRGPEEFRDGPRGGRRGPDDEFRGPPRRRPEDRRDRDDRDEDRDEARAEDRDEFDQA